MVDRFQELFVFQDMCCLFALEGWCARSPGTPGDLCGFLMGLLCDLLPDALSGVMAPQDHGDAHKEYPSGAATVSNTIMRSNVLMKMMAASNRNRDGHKRRTK